MHQQLLILLILLCIIIQLIICDYFISRTDWIQKYFSLIINSYHNNLYKTIKINNKNSL